MNYWKVAAGRNARFWENCIGDGIIFYALESIRDCRNFDTAEKIIELGKKQGEEKYAKDLVLFYRDLKIGDKIVLYGKKSIIALGRIISDYEYSKKHVFSHIRKVEWEEIYGLNLFRSDFLSESLEKKLQFNATFRELTKSEWKEIKNCSIKGRYYPISIERDIQVNVASNLHKVRKGLKLYSQEYPLYDEKFETWKRIDILAYDDENNIYVIEIKRGKAGIETLKQMSKYIKLVQKEFVDFNKIYGIIVAYDFKDELKLKVQKQDNIILIKYLYLLEFKKYS
ncbi:MAG: endonuclease NucS domain-containing protein [Candidatus Heimdallarchaeaceae archaeon]